MLKGVLDVELWFSLCVEGSVLFKANMFKMEDQWVNIGQVEDNSLLSLVTTISSHKKSSGTIGSDTFK